MTGQQQDSILIDDDSADGLGPLRKLVDSSREGREAYADAKRRRAFLATMKKTRRDAGLKQALVAVRMRTKQSTISQLESGRIDPRLSTLQRFARACNRRLDFAFVDTSAPVFDEELASEVWHWAERNMLSPLLTTIATGNEASRTLTALAAEVAAPTAIVGPFLESLQDGGWIDRSVGSRGAAVYRLADDAGFVIGITIERDRVVGVLIDIHLNCVNANRIAAFPEARPSSVVSAATDVVVQLHTLAGETAVLGVGVSIAGVVDGDYGIVRHAPDLQGRGHAWIDVPLETDLQETIQQRLPDAGLRVVVENDANALAMYGYMKSRSHSVAAILESGAGIGVGLVVHGHVIHGANSAAGEGGHMIVEPQTGPPCRMFEHRGCLEMVSSSRAILAKLEHLLPETGATSSDLEKALAAANALVHAGNAEATVAFREAGVVLGRFVATIATLFDPGRIELYAHAELADGDRYASAAAYQEGVNAGVTAASGAEFPQLEWTCLDTDVCAIAAGASALRHFLRDPFAWHPAVLMAHDELVPA